MANKRIFYAIEQVQIAGDGTSSYVAVHGVQSAGISSNYNLTQLFELGMISVYQQVEELPDITITLSKVLDGYPLIYHRATIQAPNPTMVGRSASKCQVGFGIWPDTNLSASANSVSEVIMSGQFVNSVSYKVGVNDTGTEDVTLGGNNKVWANDPNMASPVGLQLSGSDVAMSGDTDVPIAVGNQVVRRQSIQFATTGTAHDQNGQVIDADCTILPPDLPGITDSGINPLGADGNYGCHLQTISMSTDFNRTALDELGHLNPYTRYANFPCAVTTDISFISISGDMTSAIENGIYTTGVGCGSYLGNLKNRTIRLATCEGTRVYTGLKNKLLNINLTGGDTGGGNQIATFSYRTFNDFTVMHSGDPNANFSWANRYTWLTN